MQPVPYRVLAPAAAHDHPIGLAQLQGLHQIPEFRQQLLARDHDQLIDATDLAKALQRVGHHGPTGDFKEKFVHARTHAGPPAGGDNDGGVHGRRVGLVKRET